VGGETFGKLISALSFQGILYLYGALADAPTTLPVLALIAKMLVIKGHNIWLNQWRRDPPQGRR
jgi:NADPH:quinone reductase-like Zn-dependent oxidoreductase